MLRSSAEGGSSDKARANLLTRIGAACGFGTPAISFLPPKRPRLTLLEHAVYSSALQIAINQCNGTDMDRNTGISE